MKRIKILYLIDKLETGGTQRHLVKLITSMDRTVFEPLVVCLMSLGPLVAPLNRIGVPVRCLNLRRIYDCRAAGAALKLARFVRARRIPIIHSYLFSANLFAVPVVRLSGARLIISKRDLGFENTRAKKHAARLPARFADIVSANSKAVAGHLTEDEKISPEKIRITYNGVNIPDYDETEGATMDILTSHPNYSPYRRTVGTVANLKPVKNHPILLHAARRVLQRFTTAQFLIVGGGPERGRLERLAAQLGIEKRVIFLGESADVTSLLRAMDIFVLPSLHEGFPNAVIEAMAVGKPVIATERGGCVEAVIHGLTGFLFNPENARELADDIVLLLNDPQLARAMGGAGALEAKKKFSTEKMVGDFESMYVSLLDAKTRTDVIDAEKELANV